MVDRSRAQLDREPDRARLRELVAVQAEREPRGPARFEVAAGLIDIERAPLEEDVGRLRELRRVGQDVGDQEGDVRIAVGELGRDRVGAKPRRDATSGANSTQLRELGVVIEAIARLPLEGRRTVATHPRAVPRRDPHELVFARRARRTNG